MSTPTEMPDDDVGKRGLHKQKKVTIVLVRAALETVKTKKGYELVNADQHKNQLLRHKKDPSQYRPDIVHRSLLTLLDSPLNKAGHLQIYVQTMNNVLIEVSPHLRLPRTFKRFSGLMVQLLHKLKIRASDGPTVLLKVVKNPVTDHLPAGVPVLGTSTEGDLVDLNEFVPTLHRSMMVKKRKRTSSGVTSAAADKKARKRQKLAAKRQRRKARDRAAKNGNGDDASGDDDDDDDDDDEDDEDDDDDDDDDAAADDNDDNEKAGDGDGELDDADHTSAVYVFGTHAHGPADVDFTDQSIAISRYHLSASMALGRLCHAYEQYYGIV
jgi:rRNA small subunit pseudouridine methyltransferase Nep1